MLKTLTTAALAVLAASLMLSRASADGIQSTNCLGGWTMFSCVTTWRHWAPPVAQPPTEQEIAESRERIRRWEARCRPVLRQGEFGVRRYVYAAPGCEYGQAD